MTRMLRHWARAAGLAAAVLTTGCATRPAAYDYSAFNAANPRSMLVMPPVNDSPEIKATAGVWAQATLPLAEAGYYVVPVTLVDETFQQNGVPTAHDAANIPLDKLREFFGADAAVYIKVKRYGTTYAVISSETRVDVEATIVDLRSGQTLWEGAAQASSAERQQSSGGLVAMLVTALIQQVVHDASDAAYNYAGIANQRLLGAVRIDGVPPGPRSAEHGKPMPTR